MLPVTPRHADDWSRAATRSTSSDTVFTIPSASSGTRQCLELVSRWLADCVESHGAECSDRDEAILPKRVLEIEDAPQDGELRSRLVTTNGCRGKYVALSYCWGPGPFFNLTFNNIEDLHESLPMELLPGTILDAMVFARNLGFRYLWVDSLCIIQGSGGPSTADWEEQSQDMGRIYQSASLTVAAASAKDCRDGLFHTRPDPETPYCSVLQRRKGDDIVYLGADLPDNKQQMEPLSQRGWALQEAVLSRRLVAFGTTELSWECRCCSYRETVSRALPKEIGSTSMLGTASEILSSWVKLVEKYSHRDLTFQTDKLPAISGLASVVSRALGHEFHFGIWKHQAHHMLLWKHSGRIREDNLVFSRQNTPCAPTWSWASVDGRVEFLKGAVEPVQLDIQAKSVFITGRLTKIHSIRYQVEGSYHGSYEQYRPWMRFQTTMKTFVDDLSDIPEANRRSLGSRPKELADVWFFFLGKREGLILISDEPVANDLKTSGWKNMRRLQSSISIKAHRVRRFRRVGAFVGHNEPRMKQEHLEMVEII